MLAPVMMMSTKIADKFPVWWNPAKLGRVNLRRILACGPAQWLDPASPVTTDNWHVFVIGHYMYVHLTSAPMLQPLIARFHGSTRKGAFSWLIR
jgi:hypothetical protein